jgi:hypothetical protein
VVTIDALERVIHVPKAFMTMVSPTLYELDVNALRLALKSLEDDAEGMAMPDTHRHNTVLVLSGVAYARSVEIINGYTVEFEDGQYVVRCVGANHNLADVKVLNQVSLVIGNSAGLVEVSSGSGSGPTASEVADAVWGHASATSLLGKMAVAEAILRNKTVTDPVSGIMTVYDVDGVTPLLVAQLYEGITASQPYRGQGAERRERLV